MQQIWLQVLLTVGILIPTYSYSASRITGEADKKMRCTDTPLPVEECDYRRKKALEVGCINQEEYNDLVRYGSAPSCNTLRKVDTPLQYLEGWCACGCFAPFTKIAVTEKSAITDSIQDNFIQELLFVKAKKITTHFQRYNLVHLTDDATLHNLQITASPIRISTEGMEKKELVQIVTEDYRKLLVTPRHPILTSNGTMVMARDLRPDHLLVNRNGNNIGIKSLSTIPFKGKVYNFMSESDSHNGHVIFAEDLAVGDLYWQSSLEDQYNQEFIRSK